MALINVNHIELNLNTITELESRFIAFDFETTGRSPKSDRIIEIGAVLFENGIPVSRFQTLVKTGVRNPPAAQRVNNISNDMLEKVKEILAQQLDVEVEEIKDNSDIQEDLGADSLDVMDIMTEIEDAFDIEVEDEAIEDLRTPAKIAKYLESK